MAPLVGDLRTRPLGLSSPLPSPPRLAGLRLLSPGLPRIIGGLFWVLSRSLGTFGMSAWGAFAVCGKECSHDTKVSWPSPPCYESWHGNGLRTTTPLVARVCAIITVRSHAYIDSLCQDSSKNSLLGPQCLSRTHLRVHRREDERPGTALGDIDVAARAVV